VQGELGRAAEGLPNAERALQIVERVHGPSHNLTAADRSQVAELELLLGRAEPALSHFEQAAAAVEKLFGPTDPRLAPPLRGAGEALLALDRPAEAAPRLTRALGLAEGSVATPPGELVAVRFALARALWAVGDEKAIHLAAGHIDEMEARRAGGLVEIRHAHQVAVRDAAAGLRQGLARRGHDGALARSSRGGGGQRRRRQRGRANGGGAQGGHGDL